MKWLTELLGSRSITSEPRRTSLVRRITVRNPLVIESPRIGFFNLLGSSAEGLLEEDRLALASLFASSYKQTDHPPVCDVLMIYARVQGDGSIVGYPDGLRAIIRDANAAIAIVASENEGQSYIAAARKTGYGQANIVLTVNRRGGAFANFYKQLFGQMFEGTSMPLAWVKLAPQAPGLAHEGCPGALFIAEISYIIFKR